MRISKLWSAVCAAAFLPGFLSVRAQDNPAQAAARAALMAKMGELNAQQTPPANPGLAPVVLSPSGAAAEQTGPPTKATTSSPPPVVTKPVPAPAPPETPPAPAGANDTPAQAAARAALMAKMSGL